MSLCVDLTHDEGAAADNSVGGKARSLRRIAAAGLRVPAAFAIGAQLFRRLRAGGPELPRALRTTADLAALDRARDALLTAPWPPDFLAELDRHLDRLESPTDDGARFSVRSSFAREDGGGGDGTPAIAAGIYESVVGVPRAGVPAAIRRVLASALSAGAFTYAHGADLQREGARNGVDDGGDLGGGVLIHGYIPGEASGSAAFDPAAGGPMVIETDAVKGALAPATHAALERALRELAARQGHAVEVEWVADQGQLIFLQLRRYVAPPAPRPWAPAAALGDGAWRWDAAHNPLPLSPAQAGLVALVDARCRIGIIQRVVGGYLFYAPGGPAPRETLGGAAATDELRALSTRVEAPLRALAERPVLEEALAIFETIYQCVYGVIQPAARSATRALEDFLRAHAADDLPSLPALYAAVPSVADERRRCADKLIQSRDESARADALAAYLARFGDESPIWDVAVPTYREDPTRLRALTATTVVTAASAPSSPETGDRGAQKSDGDGDGDSAPLAWQLAAQEIRARLPPDERALFGSLLETARRARAVGEDDDQLYARAQAVVRAALRHEGERLAQRGALAAAADVFWLPLDQVRAFVAGFVAGEPPPARATLDAQVATARAVYQQALQDPPPTPITSGRAPERAPAGGIVSRGQRASAGRVIGPAFVHRPTSSTGEATRRATSASPPTSASIVVAATLLPTELPLLPAAGLVVETGGVLDHVAAQARERGIPALVGAHGACAGISDGDLLLLDADAGQLIRLDTREGLGPMLRSDFRLNAMTPQTPESGFQESGPWRPRRLGD